MNKPQRQYAIKELVLSREVGSQEELAALLKKRGFDVTQATLSRDLAELGVSRHHTDAGLRYSLGAPENELKHTPLVTQEVTAVEQNEVLIVIRTLPGRAPGVASYLDSLRHPSILGTVAGDDTVFVSPASVKRISATMKLIKELLFS